jgi:hypothetical protein
MFRQIAGRHEEVEDPGLEKVLPNFRALDFRPENINSYIILLILIYFVIFFHFCGIFSFVFCEHLLRSMALFLFVPYCRYYNINFSFVNLIYITVKLNICDLDNFYANIFAINFDSAFFYFSFAHYFSILSFNIHNLVTGIKCK